ncbi:MAG: cytochrome c, partial [Gemmatimonadales bacterium]
MRSIALKLMLLAVTVVFATATQDTRSAGVTSPVVAGYEQLRRSNLADEKTMGEVLLGELNCLSCHTVSDPARNGIADRIATKPAPDLSEIGRRVTPDWLASYLADPHAEKPGSTMPDIFHSFAPQERDDMVERITHFLLRQGGEMESPEHRPFRFQATVERGRGLFHSIGCVACHAPEQSSEAPATPSVPLPNLAARTSVSALAEFLLEPDRVRPGGRMPSFYLSEEEATDIA